MGKVVVTGGAGFVGSNLVDALVSRGLDVRVVDDFSTGNERFLECFDGAVHRVDLTDESADLKPIFEGADVVYHFAANADLRFGWNDTRRDLSQNVVATLRVAEAARAVRVPDVVFSSTSSVYGDTVQVPTPEDAAFPAQTSLYGASKVSAEAFLSAFASNGSFRATVLRFVSVLGPRYTHGHVIDFVRQLVEHPQHLTVLGDGTQRKSYMHVDDCVRGVMDLRAPGEGTPFGVFNLGIMETSTVSESVEWVAARMSATPHVEYGNQSRGWVGDNPLVLLDVAKAKDHGWEPRRGIRESIEDTVN